MFDIGSLIRTERHIAGFTLDTLAEAIGVSKSYLSLIESGKRLVSEERLALIESMLGIEDERLVAALRWDRTPGAVRSELEELSKRERTSRALADRLRTIARQRTPGKRGQQVLDDLLRSGELKRWVEQHSDNIVEVEPNGYRIPVINKVAAGYPREFTDLDYPASIADEYITCPDVADPDAFAARVVGDSMVPEYREGDIVVFSPLLPTPSGSDCFIRLERDNETTFKRIYYEGESPTTIRLAPVNQNYPVRRVRREEIGGMYAAAYAMRKVEPGGRRPRVS